ncbi:MAG: hypothetical protein JO043_00485 [Candidatus Eremiobacteraeota bacterium]|nr:hypothetical protein [Candidatus Eremiobacteraeota bacterium]
MNGIIRGSQAPAGTRIASEGAASSSLLARCLSLVLAALIGFAVSWQVLREPGVVGFVHDWSIWPFPEQHLALLRQSFDGWYRWGLGQPLAYPVAYPLQLAFASVAVLGLGGAAMSKCFLVAVPALAFLCATYLGRRCGLPLFAAWLTGAFYALDPVMLNKLVSGQATYLVGYAVLPMVPALLLVALDRWNAVLAGIAVAGALALTAMELQLGILVFGLAALVLGFSSTVPLRRRLFVALGAFASMALMELPTLVWMTHGLWNVAQLDQFRHGASWLAANSLQPGEALRLIGYLTRYDVLAIGSWMNVWQPASWVVVVTAFLGLLLLRGPLRPALLVATLLALAFACGTNTPLGVPITRLFERFTGAQVFRELYHVMALPSLAYAIGTGVAIGAIARARVAVAVRVPVMAFVIMALGVYLAPMLSGDVSGWLSAVPIDRYLARTFHDENKGPTRAVWFPMDQPLAFDEHGAGGDPMGVTARGSLWLYSLAWPLTAVDMDARSRNMTALRDDLRALGVGVAIERDRLHSRYRSIPAVSDAVSRFFDPDVRLDARLGEPQDEGSGVRAFNIGAPLPMIRTVAQAAIVPRRFSVIRDIATRGAVPFGYGQAHPPNVPYDAYYDSGDRPWEALQTASLAQPEREAAIDPFSGFAGGDLWWWWRPQYADAHRFMLALGSAEKVVPVSRELDDAMFVVAWIASPAGGALLIQCGMVQTVVETGGVWNAWRSQALPCGAVSRSDTVRVVALDPGAEVALRGAELVDTTAYRAAMHRLDALFSGAQRRIRLDTVRMGVPVRLRTGSGPGIGTLQQNIRAVLDLVRRSASSPATVGVASADGFLAAFGRFAEGERRLRIPLLGAAKLRIITPAPLERWTLWTFGKPNDTAPPVAAPSPAGPRIVVFNSTFDGGWHADGSTAHLVTALGTNAFVVPQRSAAKPHVHWAYAAQYHVAYVLSTLAFIITLAITLTITLHPRSIETAS